MTERQKSILKIVAPYITMLITVGGFWFSMTGVFQTKTEALAQEQKTVMSLDTMQQTLDLGIEQMRRDNRISDLTRKLDFLVEYKHKLKMFLRDHEDADTRAELREVEDALKDTKDDLDKLLSGN